MVKKRTTKAKVRKARQARRLTGLDYNSPEERKALIGEMDRPTPSTTAKKSKKKKQGSIDDQFAYLDRW
jgi:hypothetical protein